jgi:Heparinase II/III-like protein
MHDQDCPDLPLPSRRHFVAGSAALLASASLFARGTLLRAEGVVDSAAPRGKERNLLTSAYSAEKVASVLIPLVDYKPFPTIHDRAGWDGLRSETRATLLADGEKYLGFHWPEMPATVFLEYARMGNRSDYENIRNRRMGALQALVYAECVEAKGRFTDDIVNGLWATCEESFWGVPAHLYIQKADLGLPDPHDPIVDLFAAQTAALVASAVYLLGDTLDKVNPLVRERCIFEAERRILQPCLAQNFMWMGLPGGKPRHDLPWLVDPKNGEVQAVNNWDAWICWNWLTTILFLDHDAARRAKGVQKAMLCMDKFINTYPDDGGCEEGPGYWSVATGALFEGLELLRSATHDTIDLYKNPMLLQMALYMPRTQIGGEFYINQGDASSILRPDADKLFRMGKRLHSEDIVNFGVATIPPNYLPTTLPSLFDEVELRKHTAEHTPLYRDTWLPETHVMAARKRAGSTEGMYLACIASDNGKSHSHNDTGSFWVYSDGLPILIDLGQESYQKKSFDIHRYEIPTTQSSWHNLPTIGDVRPGKPATQTGPAVGQTTPGDGIDQGVGPQFGASDINYRADDATAELSMELRKAYPAAAKLRSWRRTVRLTRAADKVEINDSYLLDQPMRVTLNLITTCTITEPSKGVLELTNPVWGTTIDPKPGATTAPVRITYDPAQLTYSVETMVLENAELTRNWGSKAFRIRLTAKPATSGKLNLLIATSR